METVLFVSPHAPALAEAAVRCFNEFADPKLARSLAESDASAREAAARVALVVSMGGCSEGGRAAAEARIEWATLDPRAMMPGTERTKLTVLRRHVLALLREHGWLLVSGKSCEARE